MMKMTQFNPEVASITSTANESSCYEELSEKLLELDRSILSVTIASATGDLLKIKYVSAAEALKPNRELLDKAGALVAMISALVSQGEAPYGGCEYIIIAYEKLNVAVLPIPRKHIIVALGTTPDASAAKICSNALGLLGRSEK
jgi:hypothetical protein